jgi:ribosomal protein S27AE
MGIILAVYSLVIGRRRSSLRSQSSVSYEDTSVEAPAETVDSSHIAEKRSPWSYAASFLIAVGLLVVLYSVVVILSDSLSNSSFRDQYGAWNWNLYFAANPWITTGLQLAPMLIFFGLGLQIVASRWTPQGISILTPITSRKSGHHRTAEIKEVLVEPTQSKSKKCPYCGAEVSVERIICGKCQMPA